MICRYGVEGENRLERENDELVGKRRMSKGIKKPTGKRKRRISRKKESVERHKKAD